MSDGRSSTPGAEQNNAANPDSAQPAPEAFGKSPPVRVMPDALAMCKNYGVDGSDGSGVIR